MKNLFKYFQKSNSTLDQILKNQFGNSKKVIKYASLLEKDEAEDVLKKALNHYVSIGYLQSAEHIARELRISLTNLQKITILKINIKENRKNIRYYLELAESINETVNERKELLEQLLRIYLEDNYHNEVEKTLFLLNRGLTRDELVIYLKSNLENGCFKKSQEIAKQLGRTLTQDELIIIFDNLKSYKDNYFNSAIELLSLINDKQKRYEKILSFLGTREKSSEEMLLINMISNSKTKNEALNTIFKKKIHLSSKLEIALLMDEENKLKSINLLLEDLKQVNYEFDRKNFEKLLSYFNEKERKNKIMSFLKFYIKERHFFTSMYLSSLIGIHLNNNELDIFLESYIKSNNFNDIKYILEKYPKKIRQKKIRSTFEKIVSLGGLSWATTILDYFDEEK